VVDDEGAAEARENDDGSAAAIGWRAVSMQVQVLEDGVREVMHVRVRGTQAASARGKYAGVRLDDRRREESN
jgi:hypothetical protein